jgi:DNA-binding transcriptional LysR family regulator
MAAIKISQLEMLVRVADAGSFTAASVDMGCTQSRVSQAIAELERSVGAKLLLRSPIGCTLTHEGELALAHAREILRLAASVSALGHVQSKMTGEVRVACFRSVATHLLPHVVESLAERHPGLHIVINDDCSDYDDVTRAVEDGEAHIGITRGPVADHFVVRPFVTDPYVVIAPASAQLNCPANWNELAALPFIHIQQPGARWIIEQCRASGFTQRPARHLATESGVVGLVARGLGYTVLPRLTVFPDASGTKLLQLPFSANRQLVMFAKPASARRAMVRTAMQFIADKRIITKTEAWKAGVVVY